MKNIVIAMALLTGICYAQDTIQNVAINPSQPVTQDATNEVNSFDQQQLPQESTEEIFNDITILINAIALILSQYNNPAITIQLMEIVQTILMVETDDQQTDDTSILENTDQEPQADISTITKGPSNQQELVEKIYSQQPNITTAQTVWASVATITTNIAFILTAPRSPSIIANGITRMVTDLVQIFSVRNQKRSPTSLLNYYRHIRSCLHDKLQQLQNS